MRRARLLPLLPPALLAVVACTQLVTAHATPLAPWKGGGFGMFSTFDNTRTRTVRLRLVTDEGTFGVVGPRGARTTRSWPRAGALRAQAREAACARWRLVPFDALDTVPSLSPSWHTVYDDPDLHTQSQLAGLAVPARQDEPGAVVRSVRAEVVRIRFDGEALVPDVLVTEAVDASATCR